MAIAWRQITKSRLSLERVGKRGIDTSHQYCALSQILPLILRLYDERKMVLLESHTMLIVLSLVSLLTIKEWMMFVKPKDRHFKNKLPFSLFFLAFCDPKIIFRECLPKTMSIPLLAPSVSSLDIGAPS